jgi:hypothetical protein
MPGDERVYVMHYYLTKVRPTPEQEEKFKVAHEGVTSAAEQGIPIEWCNQRGENHPCPIHDLPKQESQCQQ